MAATLLPELKIIWEKSKHETYELQEAMENFVFPDENKTKLIKMLELGNIFPILTGILQKSCKRSFLITLENSQKGLYVLNWRVEANALIEKSST